MKKVFVLGFALVTSGLFAQTKINKSISINANQKIVMNFDYPELIKVSTWDKNEVSIKGEVSINHGENDDAFEILMESIGNVLTVKNKIKDFDDLPRSITIVDGAKKVSFKSKEEYKRYRAENGRTFDRISEGLDIDVILEIQVPRNMETSITSVYGMVEVKEFYGPLKVVAKYGGVDVSLNEKEVGELYAKTNYGEIFSNLDGRIVTENSGQKDFYNVVFVKPGVGPRYDLESKYGNVYMRKTN